MHLGTTLRRRRVAATCAVAVAVGLTTFGVARATDDGPQGCERARLDSVERRALDSGSGPDVVVIGDSYSVGSGVGPRESWPTRLPGRVHVDGWGGSGFSADASPCGPSVSYAARAARAVAGHPDALVVVEGGLNDHAQTDADIARGFVALMGELAGHDVLVVGPPPAPSLADAVPRVDAVLARLSLAFGVDYLSMADADLDYLDDDLHPTVAGHETFGSLVAAAVADADAERVR